MFKHKFLTLFVALFCVAQLFAYDAWIDGIYYNLNSTDKTASVTRNGYNACYSGVVVIPPTITYNSQIYSVTTIGYCAFYGCKNLTSVTIPNSVTTFGSNAFEGCTSLPVINNLRYADTYLVEAVDKTLSTYTIKEDTRWIGNQAFRGCSGLTSITIPNSVTTIGDYAFYQCTCLTSVTIPNSVTAIGDRAFDGCTGLTSVTIGNSVTTIGVHAFCQCSGLTSIKIPNSVTTIGSYAFSDCSGLTSVTIGNSVTTIGDYAFSYSDLTSVTIPNSVTTIGYAAFTYCSGLTSVTIGNSVKTIGGNAFYGCYGLTKTNYMGTIADWCKINFCSGNYAFASGANPIKYSHNLFINGVEVKDLVIPNSVTTINSAAFCNCESLKSVTIPTSITKIEYDAFASCVGLIRTNYTGTIAEWCKIEFGANANPIWHSHNFYINDVEVKDLVIPEGVNMIGDYAFEGCSGLTSVTIPNSVTTIGNSAFSGCSGLTLVTIPNSVTTIGNSAFYGCNNLTIDYYNYSITNQLQHSSGVTLNYRGVFLEASNLAPTSFSLQNTANTDTTVFSAWKIQYEDNTFQSTDMEDILFTGLNPNSTYEFVLYVQSTNGMYWQKDKTFTFTTPALEFTTITPKVVSAGTAVVAAETNISDYETNVGFEWRKYGAPTSMPSKSGGAIVCNGVMEGKLLNLGTDSYWDVRPYYEAADGTRYYGDWITFDPSDFSYFEPTVHTYALATSPTANKVQVRGYVMTGTDDVTEQGFEYWFNGSDKSPRRMPSATPDSVYRVSASGQVMTAVLEDLAYSTTYTCRAYAVAGGKTYYGEEVQFLTPEDPRPIYTLNVIADENGSVNETVAGQYREGEQVTLIATPDEGYQFKEWSDGSTDNPYTITIMSDTTLTATFEELSEGIDEVTDSQKSQVESQKVIRDGILYIRRNGKTYNALGGEVR